MLENSKRELAAEFLGTLVLMVFGLGVNAQVTLSTTMVPLANGHSIVQHATGDFLSVNLGWGLAVMFGVYVSGAISGGHLNPAVTLAMAICRRFPWRKVAPYVVVQLAAAMIASSIILLTYREAIDHFESQPTTIAAQEAAQFKTAGIFGTYPQSFLSLSSGFLDQAVGTALLLLCIVTVTDRRNSPPETNLAPVFIGASVFLIGMAFGFNCGYAINPARDFGPRLFTYFAGWGSEVFTAGDGFWWVPIVGPCVGGILGVWAYDGCVTRNHPEMPS